MEKKPNIIILNHWDDEFSDYAQYVDHEKYCVSYITTEAGKKFIPSTVRRVETVESTEKSLDVMLAVDAITLSVGPIQHLIALSEFDLLVAAEMRSYFNIPGPKIEDVTAWRDKVAMKKIVAAAGIRAPRWLESLDEKNLITFCRTVGFPVILKPRKGAASHGVFKINSISELQSTVREIDLHEYECEEFVEGRIGHSDGVIRGGQMQFFQASEYINSCLEFSKGAFLGSVVITNECRVKEIKEFTTKALQALKIEDSAFHLEFFVSKDDELIFLEVGARVGGGEIPFIIKEVYGVDLYRLWLNAILGEGATCGGLSSKAIPSGFLMIPEPPITPVVVNGARSLKSLVPQIYAEVLPSRGQVLDGKGGYEKISGRFRLKGESSQEISAAIVRAANLFSMSYDQIVEETVG